MPGTLQVCPHVWACVFVPRACTDRAPVASVIARKVSAKSFFMGCSFHCSTIRGTSANRTILYLRQVPPAARLCFFIDANAEMGIPCGIAGIARNRRQL